MGSLLWVGFLLLIFALLALDLGVFHKNPHAITTREALGWTVVWVIVSMIFNVGVYYIYSAGWFGEGEADAGRDAAIKFFTGYLVEKMLSLDNIFVIAAIMGAFRVPSEAQHRLLYWGVLGALVMRGIMIFAGIAALREFWWLIYPLGGLLFFTGAKMLSLGDDEEEAEVPKDNILVRLVRKMVPVATEFEGIRFFTRVDGRFAVTPLLLALVAVEATDVLFAVDSVPAVFAVTLDPFIVFTSNVFAILGLRSLFFALQSMLDRFKYLKPAIALILVFIGLKMVAQHHYKLAPAISLSVIASILTVGVVVSLMRERSERKGDSS